MKCRAGVEFSSGKPCPKCGAKLGEVCWPGINADLLEVKRLRKGIQDYLDGNYLQPRSYRNKEGGNGKCPHLQWWYEPCEQCIDDHFTALLAVPQD